MLCVEAYTALGFSTGPSEMNAQPPLFSGSRMVFHDSGTAGGETSAVLGATTTGAGVAAGLVHLVVVAAGPVVGRLVVKEFGLPAIDGGGQGVALWAACISAPRNIAHKAPFLQGVNDIGRAGIARISAKSPYQYRQQAPAARGTS